MAGLVSKSLKDMMYKYVIETYLRRFQQGFLERVPQSIKDKLTEEEVLQLSSLAGEMAKDFVKEFQQQLTEQDAEG